MTGSAFDALYVASPLLLYMGEGPGGGDTAPHPTRPSRITQIRDFFDSFSRRFLTSFLMAFSAIFWLQKHPKMRPKSDEK